MREQASHAPHKPPRGPFAPFGQRYAWASAYAAAVLFDPAGPQNRYAWLTCPPRTLARKKSRTRGWPNMFSNASATMPPLSPTAALALRLGLALGRALRVRPRRLGVRRALRAGGKLGEDIDKLGGDGSGGRLA